MCFTGLGAAVCASVSELSSLRSLADSGASVAGASSSSVSEAPTLLGINRIANST
jgi:hypothetical protein